MRQFALVLALFLLAAPVLHAQTSTNDSALSVPAPTGFVNDFAGVLADSTRQLLDGLANGVRLASGAEITIVTVQTLDGRDVRMVARDLRRRWGVGASGLHADPKVNAGVVLLIATSERRVALELGNGMEAFLPAARAGRILDSLVVPAVLVQRWDEAATEGTWAVVAAFAQRFGFTMPGRIITAP
jgi:uncharacterized protein